MENIKIPVKYDDLETGTEKFRIESWPIVDPHSVVAFLVEKAGLQTPKGALSKYWNHAATFGQEWAQGVGVDTLPIGIYGDAARVFTKFSSVNIAGIFMNLILWKPQSVRMSRYLLFCIPEHQLWKHKTLNVVYRRITWSLNCLHDGLHPHVDQYDQPLRPHLAQLAGQPLPRCKLTEIRGDWSWHKKIFRFERTSWNGIQMCHHCPAVSQSRDNTALYWNYDNGSWNSHPFTLEEFINERMPAHDMCILIEFNQRDLGYDGHRDITIYDISLQSRLDDIYSFVHACMHAHMHAFCSHVLIRSFGGSAWFPSKHHQMVPDACGSLGIAVCDQWLDYDTCRSTCAVV